VGNFQEMRWVAFLPAFQRWGLSITRLPHKGIVYAHLYLKCLDSLWTVGLFNGAVVALVSHKMMLIALHQPLPAMGLFLATPCLFAFDMMILLVLFSGLSSVRWAFRGMAAVGAGMIMVCSALFASLYLEGNVELNWSQSFKVNLSKLV
jgi:hypothetical protein